MPSTRPVTSASTPEDDLRQQHRVEAEGEGNVRHGEGAVAVPQHRPGDHDGHEDDEGPPEYGNGAEVQGERASTRATPGLKDNYTFQVRRIVGETTRTGTIPAASDFHSATLAWFAAPLRSGPRPRRSRPGRTSWPASRRSSPRPPGPARPSPPSSARSTGWCSTARGHEPSARRPHPLHLPGQGPREGCREEPAGAAPRNLRAWRKSAAMPTACLASRCVRATRRRASARRCGAILRTSSSPHPSRSS